MDIRYDGKQVVVSGAASGLGAATTDLLLAAGATVTALDVAEVARPGVAWIKTDLSDPLSIDAAVAQLPANIDSLFNIAGLPQTKPPLAVVKVNFLGLRHLTEAILPRIGQGGSVTSVASTAANGWEQQVETLGPLVDTPDFAAGETWLESNVDFTQVDSYTFSKMATVLYTQRRSVTAGREGKRLNSVSPGQMATPMEKDFRQVVGDRLWETLYENTAAGRIAAPEEIAPTLIFLGSDFASYLYGANVVVDGAYTAAIATGQFDFSALV